jgi:hypothetical protein
MWPCVIRIEKSQSGLKYRNKRSTPFGSSKPGGPNSSHIHGTRVPVAEPSRRSTRQLSSRHDASAQCAPVKVHSGCDAADCQRQRYQHPARKISPPPSRRMPTCAFGRGRYRIVAWLAQTSALLRKKKAQTLLASYPECRAGCTCRVAEPLDASASGRASRPRLLATKDRLKVVSPADTAWPHEGATPDLV